MADYELHLNFLAVRGDVPPFQIFRRERAPNEAADPSAGLFAYRLPERSDPVSERKEYLVSLTDRQGFSSFIATAKMKIDLTRRVLLGAVALKSAEVCLAGEVCVPNEFIREIDFRIGVHPEGDELITLQPYYLGIIRQFGFLVDFHFRLGEGVQFNRRVQQLSGSLDHNSRRNLDYYAFRLGKIQNWIRRYHGKLFPLRLAGASEALEISNDFQPLPARQLRPKTYIVASGREYRSQFVGVKEAGPLESAQNFPPLLFVFREEDREAARRLARALKGNEPRLSFIGFEGLFHAKLTISSDPIVVRDFSKGEMEAALKRVQGASGVAPIPVVVLPPDDDEAYVTHKAVFSHACVATQVCKTDTINDDYKLKWSVANLALQVFCKSGGKPWKVKPTDEGSLIVGISQSHKMVGKGDARHVAKYFAFSILTNSSGLFESLDVIAQGDDESSYLDDLKTNLGRLLQEQAARFDKVVVHTSFKLKRREMEVIEKVVASAAKTVDKCRFATVKVNQRNRFFAVNRAVNSLVPYEGSYVRLGHQEYLLWFEGVFPDNPNVKKAFPGPTHLDFLKVSEEPMIGDTQVLQDMVNLSGANWRGFNAKSAPVSVYYCHLVAELLRRFQERDLPVPEVKDLRPWFL